MIDINKLDDKEKEQYFRIIGPAIATNNIAKNCHGILITNIMLINNEIHAQIAQKLATAIDCLKNCIELNDNIIDKASEQFIKEYEEKNKKDEETSKAITVNDENEKKNKKIKTC